MCQRGCRGEAHALLGVGGLTSVKDCVRLSSSDGAWERRLPQLPGMDVTHKLHAHHPSRCQFPKGRCATTTARSMEHTLHTNSQSRHQGDARTCTSSPSTCGFSSLYGSFSSMACVRYCTTTRQRSVSGTGTSAYLCGVCARGGVKRIYQATQLRTLQHCKLVASHLHSGPPAGLGAPRAATADAAPLRPAAARTGGLPRTGC